MGDDLEIRQRPMTLISAPAEYGKSTLLSDWLATEQLPYDDIRVAGDVFQGVVRGAASAVGEGARAPINTSRRCNASLLKKPLVP